MAEPVEWPNVAARSGLGRAGSVGWQAFAPGGLFTNPSEHGPQQGDALGLVVNVVALVLSARADRRSRLEHRTSAPARDAGGLLTRLPRLGDDPRLAAQQLRVHRSIPLPEDTPEGLDPDFPLWVECDKAPEVRTKLAAAARQGGLVVLVGDSSVGKTRLLYQTTVDELAGWPVLVPPLGHGAAINQLADRAD